MNYQIKRIEYVPSWLETKATTKVYLDGEVKFGDNATIEMFGHAYIAKKVAYVSTLRDTNNIVETVLEVDGLDMNAYVDELGLTVEKVIEYQLDSAPKISLEDIRNAGTEILDADPASNEDE